MSKIASGQLKVLTLSNIYNFPLRGYQHEDDGGFKAELRVISDVFWVRLCTMGDLGFAEAYMYGEVECDDLVSLFRVSVGSLPHHLSLSSL